ncbi:MAG TPA: lysylphosphatidylglycerol synthase transmembrane domain-containing protein [Candidatus Omnitrophota bacterium]|nr:lysylphosphatidylglycerol synthase transmembrane domain-containing protein [Candidatus Omnitrophota bacterium]
MKRIFALVVSLIVMAVIFIKIDRAAFSQHLAALNWFWFGIAFLFFIPQTLLSTWRWQWMIRHDRKSDFGESLRLILATSSLNVFMPSKLGDLCKAYYLAKSGQLDWKRGLNQVLFERFLDLWALCWMGTIGVFLMGLENSVGWVVLVLTGALSAVFLLILKLPIRALRIPLLPEKISEKLVSFFHDSHDYVERLKSNPANLAVLFAGSLLLWTLHVVQFYFAGLAVQSVLTIQQIFSFVPIGILIGLLPFTVAGIGTRDAAFIYLFSPYDASSKIVFLGLFATVRYLVPGLAGIPFIHQFFKRNPD